MSIPKKLEAIAKSQPQIYAAGYVAGLSGDAVLYTEQTLNEEEKAQARENIDAVGKNDYAAKGGDKVGLVAIPGVTNGNYGLIATNQNSIPGGVTLARATNAEIDSKNQKFKPIVPANLDYAIKVGMTTNTQVWTEEDRAKARELLGLTIYNGEVESV